MGKLFILQVLVLALAAIVVPTAAFLAPSTSSFVSRSILDTSLSLSSDKNNRRDVFQKSRTDIRNFLTQRSIQSFVFLLNQCREDHTVRWLEKTLDFTSIDNFHGTGAFNQTKFPEWDSVFLECVDRPEEVMVIQMRQRRRQSKLSGHNAYFESLKTNSSLVDNKKDEAKTEESPKPTAFSTSNYLDAMKADTNLTASAAAAATPTAPEKPKITSKKLSSASSYLDNLSKPVKAKKPWSPNASKKKDNDDDDDDDNEKKDVVAKKKEETKPPRRAFSSSSFLDNLSAATPAFDDSEKSKQSTETTKNPYLEEKTKEYELSIDPPALVRRMLSVREQISQEWEEDLDMLIKLNDEITESIEEYNSQNAAKNDNDEDDDSDEENLKIDSKKDDKSKDEKESDLDALLKALLKDSKIDSPPQSSPNEASESNKETAKDGPKVFDRNILNLWSQTLWSPKRSSSPYRKANFDLLLLLATQESIHRVLNSYKNDKSVRAETHEWFLDFYIDNVNEYFDGHQTYARSEDFLKEMIQSPRTLIETNNDILAWIDPAVIAEDIIRERSEVILNWMEVAKTISEEHTDLRRLLFTNMVSKSFPEDESQSPLPDDTIITAVDVSEIQKDEEDSASSPTEVFGAFE